MELTNIPASCRRVAKTLMETHNCRPQQNDSQQPPWQTPIIYHHQPQTACHQPKPQPSTVYTHLRWISSRL
ncbi:hypothetical protein E2C01_098193 [Portunus trituberculatus]|uniref:Uncharacterized protein n=1 Tax=Portunus trituberculatus TaxID=210409 RepID=A0A5B7K6G9_PORTR|nr:hypothetical protein [Portunus trituberculatus]